MKSVPRAVATGSALTRVAMPLEFTRSLPLSVLTSRFRRPAGVRYDSTRDGMEGQLTQHPTAELIREIAAAKLSGALRLSRGQAQAAVYFDAGTLTFAASNLRAHRLPTVLARAGILSEAQLAKLPRTSSDDELAAA